MTDFLNLSAYRFVAIDDPQTLADALRTTAQAHQLLGTVLVATEGLNLNLAGTPAAANAWWRHLMEDRRFADTPLKRSVSDRPPFKRLRVKVKAEIIRMNQPTVQPATLARWLAAGRCDAGRPLALLDTRNRFEVDAGAFDGAIDWRLGKFSDFPAAAAAHREQLRGHTVVSYCTGGIRCEKAALALDALGAEHVLQLDGGILRYFEDTGDAPGWRGRCVVFDERESLDPALAPVPAAG